MCNGWMGENLVDDVGGSWRDEHGLRGDSDLIGCRSIAAILAIYAVHGIYILAIRQRTQETHDRNSLGILYSTRLDLFSLSCVYLTPTGTGKGEARISAKRRKVACKWCEVTKRRCIGVAGRGWSLNIGQQDPKGTGRSSDEDGGKYGRAGLAGFPPIECALLPICLGVWAPFAETGCLIDSKIYTDLWFLLMKNH